MWIVTRTLSLCAPVFERSEEELFVLRHDTYSISSRKGCVRAPLEKVAPSILERVVGAYFSQLHVRSFVLSITLLGVALRSEAAFGVVCIFTCESCIIYAVP